MATLSFFAVTGVPVTSVPGVIDITNRELLGQWSNPQNTFFLPTGLVECYNGAKSSTMSADGLAVSSTATGNISTGTFSQVNPGNVVIYAVTTGGAGGPIGRLTLDHKQIYFDNLFGVTDTAIDMATGAIIYNPNALNPLTVLSWRERKLAGDWTNSGQLLVMGKALVSGTMEVTGIATFDAMATSPIFRSFITGISSYTQQADLSRGVFSSTSLGGGFGSDYLLKTSSLNVSGLDFSKNVTSIFDTYNTSTSYHPDSLSRLSTQSGLNLSIIDLKAATLFNYAGRWTSLSDFNVSGNLMQGGVLVINNINVKNFGALGNGVTDDKIAVQNAIDAAKNAGGGTVFFPQGTYYLNGCVYVTGDNITLDGGNKLATIKGTDQDDIQKFWVSGVNNINIIGLNFDAGRTNKTSASNFSGIITLEDAKNVKIVNNNLSNGLGSAIYLWGDTSNINVKGNTFTGNFCGIYSYPKTTTSNYLTGNSPNQVIIDGNNFGPTWATGLETAAIKLQNNPSFTGFSDGMIVTNNNIDSTCQMGIEFWKSIRNSNISSNTIIGTEYGISIDNSSNISVMNNNVRSTTYLCFEAATNCDTILFQGNTAYGYGATGTVRTPTYGFSTSNVPCNNISYVGNSVVGCSYGFNIQNSLNTLIQGNFIKDNLTQVFYDGASLGKMHGNTFETGANLTAYHVFFGANNRSLTGFHLSQNKFRGVTSNQSIFYYNNNGGNSLSGICIENNTTDFSTSGGFATFIGGQFTPANYTYNNNFAPLNAGGYNSIPNANDNGLPFQQSDILAANQYYNHITYTIPASGISGAGAWLCVWSGDPGGLATMRNKIKNDSSVDNISTDCEVFSTLTPYSGPTHALTSNPQSHYNGELIQQIRTQNEPTSNTASLWVKYGAVTTGSVGAKIYSYYSQSQNLTGIYVTSTEPTWVSESASLRPTQFHYENFKVSKGITIGNATEIESPASGVMTINGNSIGINSNQNIYDLELSGVAHFSQRTTLTPNIIISSINSGALNFGIGAINSVGVNNTGMAIGLYLNNTLSANMFVDAYANVGINGYDYVTQFCSGHGSFYLGNTTTRPSGAPTAGGCFFASGGNLFWIGSAGTITKIANA